MKILGMFFLLSLVCLSNAQQTKRALFIGNSYTAYNNLPQMVSQCATSTGDQLIFNSNTPGGSTFQGHTTNSASIEKIEIGDWDFVSLQEQSQLPAFSDGQVQQDVFPYATQLNDLIKLHNPCAETIFYMTWGRKNGDANNCPVWPPVCTYEGMDSLLYLRYMQMAQMNDALVSPVGQVWGYLRENHPNIELYTSDESHPSYAGSYAAACSFYTVIFRKDPTLISWNGNLSQQEAQTIRNAAKLVVFDNLSFWRVGLNDPVALYETTNSTMVDYTFINQSQHYQNSTWFIDGVEVSTDQNLNYTFPITGLFNVKLVVDRCAYQSIYEEMITVGFMNLDAPETTSISVYPNPATNELIVENAPFSAIQISDLSGKIVLSEISNNAALHTIDISKFEAGVYILISSDQRFLIVKK